MTFDEARARLGLPPLPRPINEPLTVRQLKPAWSRLMLCRYILRLKARIRELEAELAEHG
jgi:hypothetical protein